MRLQVMSRLYVPCLLSSEVDTRKLSVDASKVITDVSIAAPVDRVKLKVRRQRGFEIVISGRFRAKAVSVIE
jgi:hypothetical protein